MLSSKSMDMLLCPLYTCVARWGMEKERSASVPAEFALRPHHPLNFPRDQTSYSIYVFSSFISPSTSLSFCLLIVSQYFPLPVLPCLLNSYSCFSPYKFLQILSRPLCLPQGHCSCGRVSNRLSCPFDFTRGSHGSLLSCSKYNPEK